MTEQNNKQGGDQAVISVEQASGLIQYLLAVVRDAHISLSQNNAEKALEALSTVVKADSPGSELSPQQKIAIFDTRFKKLCEQYNFDAAYVHLIDGGVDAGMQRVNVSGGGHTVTLEIVMNAMKVLAREQALSGRKIIKPN